MEKAWHHTSTHSDVTADGVCKSYWPSEQIGFDWDASSVESTIQSFFNTNTQPSEPLKQFQSNFDVTAFTLFKSVFIYMRVELDQVLNICHPYRRCGSPREHPTKLQHISLISGGKWFFLQKYSIGKESSYWIVFCNIVRNKVDSNDPRFWNEPITRKKVETNDPRVS